MVQFEWRSLLSPSGRMGRIPFILFTVIHAPVWYRHKEVLDAAGEAFVLVDKPGLVFTKNGISMALLYFALAAKARRCRDAGYTPWLAFLTFVPFVNIAFLLWCMNAPPHDDKGDGESVLKKVFFKAKAWLGEGAMAPQPLPVPADGRRGRYLPTR